MIPWTIRRYPIDLADAVDELVNEIYQWEDGRFSASAVDLTRVEAQKIAAHLIRDLLIAGMTDPLGIDSQKLLEVLERIRMMGVADDDSQG